MEENNRNQELKWNDLLIKWLNLVQQDKQTVFPDTKMETWEVGERQQSREWNGITYCSPNFAAP